MNRIKIAQELMDVANILASIPRTSAVNMSNFAHGIIWDQVNQWDHETLVDLVSNSSRLKVETLRQWDEGDLRDAYMETFSKQDVKDWLEESLDVFDEEDLAGYLADLLDEANLLSKYYDEEYVPGWKKLSKSKKRDKFIEIQSDSWTKDMLIESILDNAV